MRELIEKKCFDQERALYHSEHTDVVDCLFAGPADGESALKESRDIALRGCSFSLRYPLWHVEGFSMDDCAMDESCRAALWYDRDGKIVHSRLGGIKALRECGNILLEGTDIVSPEFGWKCHDITMKGGSVQAEYLFLDSRNVTLDGVSMKGKYSFQYIHDLTVTNCDLDTKDAFWHTKNATVRDSVVKGEYLGWYSEGLTLVHCRIIGTQPLCYCKNLTLVDCTMEDCDLAFEYSDVVADIKGKVDSIKNPASGTITVDEVGSVIMDDAVRECKGKIVLRGDKKGL